MNYCAHLDCIIAKGPVVNHFGLLVYKHKKHNVISDWLTFTNEWLTFTNVPLWFESRCPLFTSNNNNIQLFLFYFLPNLGFLWEISPIYGFVSWFVSMGRHAEPPLTPVWPFWCLHTELKENDFLKKVWCAAIHSGEKTSCSPNSSVYISPQRSTLHD